jgi:two-component system, LytTR family, response regulator
MKVLIIEDEKPAAEKLERYLKRYDANIEVSAVLDGVSKAVNWLDNPDHQADLIFMDIQLNDGLSFEIFEQTTLRKPVIFTTAFDNYALKAFEVSGVAYLLKPITYPMLEASMQKVDHLRKSFNGNTPSQADLLRQALAHLSTKTYKSRFMVKAGEHIHTVEAGDIAAFFAVDRYTFLLNSQGRRFIVDYTLEDLEGLLDPSSFFRVSRSFIIHIKAISKVAVYSSNRLLIQLSQEFDKEIIVSRERVAPFKDWINGQQA